MSTSSPLSSSSVSPFALDVKLRFIAIFHLPALSQQFYFYRNTPMTFVLLLLCTIHARVNKQQDH